VQSAYVHEELDFTEYFEVGEHHGFGWLDRRALRRRTTLLQSVVFSLCVHMAVISIFVFSPGSSERVRSPWLEVQLVSLGPDGASPEAAQEVGSGGSPAAASPLSEKTWGAEVLPPAPVLPVVPKVPEEELKPEVSLTTAPSKPVLKRKQLAKVPDLLRKPSASEAPPAPSAQPLDPAASSSGGDGKLQAEPGASGSEAAGGAHGKGSHGAHRGGPVDAEFGALNGPRFAHRSLPRYPRLARQLGKEAIVVLCVTIDERGRPIAVEAVKPAGSGFDEEAIKAVKESLFHPAEKEGRPVVCRAILPIRFELRGSD